MEKDLLMLQDSTENKSIINLYDELKGKVLA